MWSVFLLQLKTTHPVVGGLNLTSHVSAHVFNKFISELNFEASDLMNRTTKFGLQIVLPR